MIVNESIISYCMLISVTPSLASVSISVYHLLIKTEQSAWIFLKSGFTVFESVFWDNSLFRLKVVGPQESQNKILFLLRLFGWELFTKHAADCPFINKPLLNFIKRFR